MTLNVPDDPVGFNSVEDIEMKIHTAADCELLGLSFDLYNCDGWILSGGSWISVEHSVKQEVLHR